MGAEWDLQRICYGLATELLFSKQDNAELLHTIHHNLEWLREAHMTDVPRFLNRWHSIKNLLTENSLTTILVDGEIAHTK